jgi:hypothetical protein
LLPAPTTKEGWSTLRAIKDMHESGEYERHSRQEIERMRVVVHLNDLIEGDPVEGRRYRSKQERDRDPPLPSCHRGPESSRSPRDGDFLFSRS